MTDLIYSSSLAVYLFNLQFRAGLNTQESGFCNKYVEGCAMSRGTMQQLKLVPT
jgi:hypothetical protein